MINAIGNNPIFFHETSCSKSHVPELDFFQACAVESAALANPKSDIYVLFASPRYEIDKESSLLMILLNSIGNVHFLNNDIWQYVEKTPTKDWLSTEEIFDSYKPQRQLSNFLRLVTLWKFNATFIDFNMISLTTLDNMTNFAGIFHEGQNLIGNKVLNLDHKMADLCLNDFLLNFEMDFVEHNGGWVITRVLKELCRTTSFTEMPFNKCNFTVYPKRVFYPFNEAKEGILSAPYDFSSIEHSSTVYVSDANSDITGQGEKSVFKSIALMYCPRIYSAVF